MQRLNSHLLLLLAAVLVGFLPLIGIAQQSQDTAVIEKQQAYVDEPVKVQNYPDAPIELQIVSKVSRPTESKEWFNTCFYYSVKNKTKRNFDALNYEILDRSGKTYVMGSVFLVLKPYEFAQSREQCVSNAAFTDEGFFTFRLTWVEQQRRTIWESEDHKKTVQQLFDATDPARRSRDTAVIDKFIAQQAANEHGDEYEDARKIVYGDLNHDGVPDLAVVYTIEGQDGTNNYIQYLAVFIRTKTGPVPLTHTHVGGKFNRDVDLQSIKRNVILLKTLSHRENDPASTPGKKGTARFILVKRKLKEL